MFIMASSASSSTSQSSSSDEEEDSSTESSISDLLCEVSSGEVKLQEIAVDSPCFLDSCSLKGGQVFQSRSCCCVSAEELTTHWMEQPLTGWQARDMDSLGCSGLEGPSHCISAQLSKISLSSFSDSASCLGDDLFKSGSGTGRIFRTSQALSRGVINLGSNSDSKSSLRNYIHSSPAIPYTFRHHDVDDKDIASSYMEEYKKAYTYPNLEERSRKISDPLASISTAMIKPTLFVLNNDIKHPLYYRKKQDNGAGKPKSRLDMFALIDPDGSFYKPFGQRIALPDAVVQGTRSREVVVSKNTLTFTHARAASAQLSTVQRCDKVLHASTENLDSGDREKAPTFVANHSCPPSTPITHVKPQLSFGKRLGTKCGLPTRPSASTSPVPCRASPVLTRASPSTGLLASTGVNKKGVPSSSPLHMTRNRSRHHQCSSPHFHKSSSMFVAHKT